MLRSAVVGSGGAGRNMLSYMSGLGIPLYLVNSSRDPRFENIYSSESEIRASIETELSVKRPLMETERSALSVLESHDVVFSVSGLGGFYGTAVPIMLTGLRNNVIPVFTLPFSIEGEKRREMAIKGMNIILSRARWSIVLENDRLLEIAPNATLEGAFRAMNLLVSSAIAGIASGFRRKEDILGSLEGRVGVGMGSGTGMNSQEKALREALSSPWLDIKERAVIIVRGGSKDDLIWIKEKIEEIGAEVTAESHMSVEKNMVSREIELIILS